MVGVLCHGVREGAQLLGIEPEPRMAGMGGGMARLSAGQRRFRQRRADLEAAHGAPVGLWRCGRLVPQRITPVITAFRQGFVRREEIPGEIFEDECFFVGETGIGGNAQHVTRAVVDIG